MINSFRNAFIGICRTIRVERNMRIHLVVAFYVILAGFVTRLDRLEWAIILMVIGSVLSAELINTGLEHLGDRVTRKMDVEIGAAKDAAAGCVLCSAVVAAAAGILIFFGGGHPQAAWEFAKTYPVLAVIFILLLIPGLLFIFQADRPEQPVLNEKGKHWK